MYVTTSHKLPFLSCYPCYNAIIYLIGMHSVFLIKLSSLKF